MEIINAKDLQTRYTRQDIVELYCESVMSKVKDSVKKEFNKCCFDGTICVNKDNGELKPFLYGLSSIKEYLGKGNWEWFNTGYSFADYKDEVKKVFEKHGYVIKPTGYIGGVWQRTEDICW